MLAQKSYRGPSSCCFLMREHAFGYAVFARYQDYWVWIRAWVLPIYEHLAGLRVWPGLRVLHLSWWKYFAQYSNSRVPTFYLTSHPYASTLLILAICSSQTACNGCWMSSSVRTRPTVATGLLRVTSTYCANGTQPIHSKGGTNPAFCVSDNRVRVSIMSTWPNC